MDRDELLGRALTLADEEEWAGAAELLRDHLEDFDEESKHVQREVGVKIVEVFHDAPIIVDRNIFGRICTKYQMAYILS